MFHVSCHRCFSKNFFMSIRHMKKEIPGSHYFSCFALGNLLTQTSLDFFAGQGSSLLLNMQNIHSLLALCSEMGHFLDLVSRPRLRPVTSDVSVVLSFLQEMLNKQHSTPTIKVYVAAIATFYAPIAG